MCVIDNRNVGFIKVDMIAKTELVLAEDETGGSLFDKLADAGAKLCVETLKNIEAGTVTFEKQDETQATHAKMLTKQLGNIDWNQPAVEIERLIRGLNPWPSAYTKLDGKTFKIWKASANAENSSKNPGCVCKVAKGCLEVQTGEGVLSLMEVQLEGKKRMEIDAFLRGYQVEEETLLG